jgi:hypothetical protein
MFSLAVVLGVVSSLVIAIKEVCVAVGAICAVAEVIVSLAKSIGLIEGNTSMEEIGEKALVAEEIGITLEAFDGDYDQYMKEFNKISTEGYDTSKWTSDEKALKAFEHTAESIVNKYGPEVHSVLKGIIYKQEFFTAERTEKYIEACVENKLEHEDVMDYLEGEISDIDKMHQINREMINIEKSLNPDITDLEARNYISEFKS